ncbi:MAG: ATP-binding protein [Clostridiales bacterium]|nr:ATP-binding protein [Clostridiales bacterium]
MPQNSLQEKILDELDIGILVMDLSGRITSCNRRALALLHVSACPDDISIFALQIKPLNDFLQDVRHGDHELIDLHARAVQLTYKDVLREDGQRLGAVVLLEDIGEKQRMARIRQEFTANVSHELKTPLTSISGYAEMIANGMAQPQDVQRFALRIQSEATRMLALVSDVIQLSELDESGRPKHIEAVDLYALALECVDILASTACLRGVEVVLDGAETIVMGNRSLLSELVYNLMENAIRYNRENGSVHVRVAGHTISVRDTGIGIPKKHQSRIFERFYRVDKSRSKTTGGTGLGLAIVKHVCEQHHAQLKLESRELVGTTITVTFP